MAQCESDAWAKFCDKLQTWPSRRNCRELSIVKGKKVELSEVERYIHGGNVDGDDIGPRQIVKLSAPKKAAKQ